VEQESKSIIDVRELFWKARRYRWVALLPIVLMLCAAFLYLKLATPVYQSGVTISLEDRAPVSQAMEGLVGSPSNRENNMLEKVARVRNRVLNRTFLEAVNDRLGLSRDLRMQAYARAAVKKYPYITPDEYATRVVVSTLAQKVSVTPVGSSYIKIAVKDPSPDQARRLATAVSEGLIEDTRRSTLTQVQARGEHSQDLLAVYAEQVRQAEDKLRNYEESIAGHSIATGPVSGENVSAVRELTDAADKEMDQVRERIQSDRATWSARAGSGAAVPDLRSQRSAELETRLNGLESSFGAAAVRREGGADNGAALLQQIGTARQALLSEYESAAMSLPGDLPEDAKLLAAGIALDRAVLRSLQARKSRLQGMLGSYMSEVRSNPREQMELERLRNDVTTKRDLVAKLQAEATSSRISEAMETSQLSLRIQVVEAPQLPLKPVWPDRLKVLLAAFLLGPLCSVGIIMGAERVGAILRTVEQAEEELGTKVIGTIPRIEGWSRPGSFLQNNWAPLSILTILLLTAIVTGVFTTVNANRPGGAATGEMRR
jgi:succinoglycan biosynthesis transport protein ExoP